MYSIAAIVSALTRCNGDVRRAAAELGGLFVQMEGAEFPAEFFEGIFFDEWPADVGTMLRVMALDPLRASWTRAATSPRGS